MRVKNLSIFSMYLALVGLSLKVKGHSIDKPHIIFLVADDLGWNDVSFHGSDEIPTPNIDALAYNGVILNRHYVLPVCSASRSALLTGRYPIRDGMQGADLKPGEVGGIPLNRTLMPEYLRQLGYGTHLLGKWNVGYYSEKHTPTRRGFDSFYGFYNELIGYYDHKIDLETDGLQAITGNDLHRDTLESLEAAYDFGYITDLMTEEAEKIININGNKKPLFLELAYLATHGSQNLFDPLQVPDAEETNATFAYIKDFQRRKYAGMVKSLDDSVGRIVTSLDRAGMLQNSIIVFVSDNGAKTAGFYGTTGSNYPLRGMKNTVFEGAVRGTACIFSPLIKSAGRVSEEMMHLVDWLPTLYAAAGGNVRNIHNIDGMNQWPMISEGAKTSRDSVLINIDIEQGFEGVIFNNYKLIRHDPRTFPIDRDYYGDSGNSPLYPDYQVESALSSPAGLAISHLAEFISTSTTKARGMRQSSQVTCQRPKDIDDCLNICLFDIQSDPCETKDLSQDEPEMKKLLKALLNNYEKVTLPRESNFIDPNSFPNKHNGTWMPWIRN